MSNIYLLPSQPMIVCSLLFSMSILSVRSMNISTKFNIVLQTPNKTSSSTEVPHKSIHVKYTLQDHDEQWNIVGFEPQIRKSVEQLTVHICHTIIHRTIWYDDLTVCENAESMLIYEWTPVTSLSPFRLSDDNGFEFDKSKSIIFTVVYRKEKRVHREQSGIILYISTLPTRFQMGTMLVGNRDYGTHFSCRSSTFPRLLYGVKKILSEKIPPWWRIHVIRMRQFGRKLVQPVLDSERLSYENRSYVDVVGSDLFLISGDYLLIECENVLQSNCYFLLYFMYKSKSITYEETCHNNDFPQLFKLIPPKEIFNTNRTTTDTSGIDGSTIFLIVLILLFVIWISIIIGCIIMRRIRGLVNFRTEPPSPLSSQKNKLLAYTGRGPDHFHGRTGDADHVIQVDGEHAGGA